MVDHYNDMFHVSETFGREQADARRQFHSHRSTSGLL